MATARFRRPTREKCLEAIGIRQDKGLQSKYELLHTSGSDLEMLLPALIPDDEFFKPIPKPKSDDWLACHREDGQQFPAFSRGGRNIPNRRRHTLYILPVCFFEMSVPDDVIQDLLEFASHFFGMEVKLMKKVDNLSTKVPSRINEYTEKVQIHAGKMLEVMGPLVPGDAFCVGALTLCDLYPRDEWNFVFGLASLANRVGVYSLARYIPGFPDSEVQTTDLTREQRAALLISASRLMCHEMCHMFGLKHCIFYHCLMNGSNHYEECERKPLHLCPVCLRKLHLACQFDIIDRYHKLKGFCERKYLTMHADWLRRRLDKIEVH